MSVPIGNTSGDAQAHVMKDDRHYQQFTIN